MNITEDYVSFETAKLLKEKGFNCNVSRVWFHYTESNEWNRISFDSSCEKFDEDKMLKCPTLQMAIKWLREVYNIHIIPYFDKIQPSDLSYSFVIYIVDEYTATREIIACFDIDEKLYWSKQEQAIEAAIKYALEILTK